MWGWSGRRDCPGTGGVLPIPLLDYEVCQQQKTCVERPRICSFLSVGGQRGFVYLGELVLEPWQQEFWSRVTLRCLIQAKGWEGPGSTREGEAGLWARMRGWDSTQGKKGERPKRVICVLTCRTHFCLRDFACSFLGMFSLPPKSAWPHLYSLQCLSKGHIIWEAFLRTPSLSIC